MQKRKTNQSQEETPEKRLGAIDHFFSTNFSSSGAVHSPLPPVKGASQGRATIELPTLRGTPEPPHDALDDVFSRQAVDGTTLEELAENIRALVVYEQHEESRAEQQRKRLAALGPSLRPSAGLSKTPLPIKVDRKDDDQDPSPLDSGRRGLTQPRSAEKKKPSAVDGRVILHSKRVRQVPGPIIVEERALVDVWPARASGGAATMLSPAPQLIADLEDELRLQLQRLNLKYPQAAKEAGLPSNCPSEEELQEKDEWRETVGRGPTPKQQQGPYVVFGRSSRQKKENASRKLPLAIVPNTSRALVLHASSPDGHSEAIGDASPEQVQKMVPKKSFASRKPLSDDDAYRRERVCLFYSAARDLSDSFKAYRRMLLWIFSEFQCFVDYCHKNVFTEEMRRKFVKETEERVARDSQIETDRLKGTIAHLTEALASTTAKLRSLETSTQAVKVASQDYDATLKLKDAELKEAAEGRAALLGRISRLEKELWRQRDALEGPEAQISSLEKQVKALEDKVAAANKAKCDVDAEKAVLKVRVERLEEVVKEKKSSAHEMVPKLEIIQIRRQYVEALELVAVLQGKNGKLTATIAALEKDLEQRRDGIPTTPRPPWQLCDEFFPRAASTAQRVHLAIKEYRFMLARNECLTRQYTDLRSMLAMQDRDENVPDGGAEPELEKDVVAYQMLWKHFPKLGFDSSVPPFLKGTGRAENLKFNRSQVKQMCRVFFQEAVVFGEATGPAQRKDQQTSNTSQSKKCSMLNTEQLLTKMATKYSPSGASAHDFLYSWWYGMQWFAYDRFISMVRKTVSGELDDSVLLGMHREARRVRDALELKASEEADAAAKLLPAAISASNETQTSSGAGSGNATLTKTSAVEILADLFGHKSEEDVKRLVAAVNRDCPGTEVSIPALVRYSAKERSFSHFLEDLYGQHLATRHAIEQLCIEAVFDASIETDGRLAPTPFAQSLWKTDPMIPAVYMDDLVSDIFEIPIEDLKPAVDERGVRRVGLNGNRLYLHNDLTLSDELSVIRRLQRRMHIPYSAMYEKE